MARLKAIAEDRRTENVTRTVRLGRDLRVVAVGVKGDRPVNEEEVDVVGPERGERLVEVLFCARVAR